MSQQAREPEARRRPEAAGTARYQAHLHNLALRRPTVAAASFSLQEEYNSGWTAVATLYSRSREPLTRGEMLSAVLANGVDAGRPMALYLALDTDDPEFRGRIVRTWPSVVSRLEPFESAQELLGAGCQVHLVDPVSYLANRPIWGAYRADSAGAMIGGALSLARGGDGKPTLNPLLPGLPPIAIVEDYREDLSEIPFSIAAGQTLGEWLGEVLGMLGLRLEMRGNSNGSISVILSDNVPRTEAMDMTVLYDEDEYSARTPAGNGAGPIHIDGFAIHPGMPQRGTVVDDPLQGPFRYFGPRGAIGNSFSGMQVELDEAARRAAYQLRGAFTEMLIVSARTRQPALRPGSRVRLSLPIYREDLWQFIRVTHSLAGAAYDNAATMVIADVSWHPPLPPVHAPIYVAGTVDGGAKFTRNEPVPRDRLGRIPISFPFTPTPTGTEAVELALLDNNSDRRVTLADFSAEKIATFQDDEPSSEPASPDRNRAVTMLAPTTNMTTTLQEGEQSLEMVRLGHERVVTPTDLPNLVNRAATSLDGDPSWEEKESRFRAGDYDDPHPGRKDSELTEVELAVREELKTTRREVYEYIVYKRAKRTDDQDHDRDGYVTSRDALVSDDLKEVLRDSKKREKLESQWKSKQAGTLAKDFPDIEDGSERMTLINQYGALFSDGELEGAEGESYAAAKEEAEVTAQKWPPRVPLALIEPMAGGMHGFIAAHRHGDACRVAVHNPFSAEIAGFQYRGDRRINKGISDAIAAMVIEHDYSNAWSGIVFRRASEMEEENTEKDEDTDEEEDDTEEDEDTE